MAFSVRRAVIRAWSFIRTAMLILWISFALLLFVEVCYRVQRAARARFSSRPLAASPAVRDPQASAPWYQQYVREEAASRPQRWKSYVYWGRRPGYRGQYVNIDSTGHRITPQPTAPATPVATVFFFGGSTMWGVGQRDEHTIAAEASRRLQGLAGGARGGRVQVTNFGEAGYIGTQGILELMFALRAGARPDVVVFYDGINDVGTTVQHGRAGIPQNESKRVAEFAMGRALDRTFGQSARDDLRALGILAGEAVHRLAFVEALRSLRASPPVTFVAADSATRSLVRVYLENARVIEALSTAYGFTAIHVWQPTLHSTTKQLTPFESQVVRGMSQRPFWNVLAEVHRAVPPLLVQPMAALAPGRFIADDTLFRGDTLPVYVDNIGHTTEIAVPRIVDSFWPQLRNAVTRRLARPLATE